ncbi:hypothetical protein [Pectinatus cerevisiiphilus]|uniref:Uncharacterized protein n=1 Tax=Pectinatus cerevisiiphilus TaxID=86956 RepID=A0A4R3K0C4_9FIRM|nr:hypothetical protein [Pectinatus cerevisiiphilus]TCS75387.1 hypothetical protein EDC37_1327 [Pectinatus cerevisiiphilus]
MTDSSIISALISLGGIIISFCITAYKTKKELKIQKVKLNMEYQNFKKQREEFTKTLQNQQTTTYKELITAERLKWLNQLRSEMSAMTAAVYSLKNKCLAEKEPFTVYDLAEMCSQVRNHGDLAILLLGPEDNDLIKEINTFIEKIYVKAGIQYEFAHRNRHVRACEIDIEELVDKMRNSCQHFLKNYTKEIEKEAKKMFISGTK